MKAIATFSVALAPILVSVVVAYMSARADAFRRATEALKDVSSGDVAKARHLIGGLSFSDGPVHFTDEERDAAVESLFVVYWAVERLRATDLSFSPRWFMPSYRAHELLVCSVGHWIRWASSDRGVVKARDLMGNVGDRGELKNLRDLGDRWKNGE